MNAKTPVSFETKWAKLCNELELAKVDYEAAEERLAGSCAGLSQGEALKASLNAAKRITAVLEKMRKLITQRD